MTTTIPSGLGTTLGMASEAGTYGAGTTVARWWLIDANEGFGLKKNVDQSNALSSTRYHLSKRRVLVSTQASGKLVMDLCATGLGLLFQGSMGSAATAVQQGATAAYLQQHVPGVTLKGFSYNFQKGMPETPSGTVAPLSYPGSKILDLTISNDVNKIAKIEANLDCQTEVTGPAYAAPTLPAPDVFSFNQLSVLFGGTPNTAGGICTITAGTAPTGVISACSVKITNKLNVARFNAGAIVKNEPIESDFADVTGDVTIEFANLTDYYNAMAADTTTALQMIWTGPIIASTFHEQVGVILPAVKWEDSSPMATNTDVVKVKVPFTALNDGTDPTVQINYQSTDTAV